MKQNKSNLKNQINFLFELGQLKRVKHEGWRLVGVEHPESVAEHSLRAAQIGYVIAALENEALKQNTNNLINHFFLKSY